MLIYIRISVSLCIKQLQLKLYPLLYSLNTYNKHMYIIIMFACLLVEVRCTYVHMKVCMHAYIYVGMHICCIFTSRIKGKIILQMQLGVHAFAVYIHA